MRAKVERASEVDAFVQRHFTWPGTLRLHRAALGLDILRAPVNVLLSPILVTVRLSGWLCVRMGARRVADRLLRRELLLRTAVAARVEAAILSELLHVPLPEGAAPRDRAGLSRAIRAAPRYREAIRKRASIAEAEDMAGRITSAIAEYTGSRSAMADLATALVTLAMGAIVFRQLTPGMISMAPGVADALARTSAIATFPLGETLGGMWYGVFAVDASPRLMGATVAGLIMIGSVFGAFAGVLADPVQCRLGIHRRRLGRLLDTIEVEILGSGHGPFVAREHFYSRVLDLLDAIVSAIRVFRN